MIEEITNDGIVCIPLFGDDSGDEDGPQDGCIKPKIAPVASRVECQVDCIDRHMITPEIFREIYRMRRPVIIKGGAASWSGIQNWPVANYFTDILDSEEGVVLVSKDNCNFLLHELCDQLSIPISQAISKILSGEDASTKIYCRLYLDQHPELADDISDVFLSELAVKVADGTSIEPAKFSSKNIGVWISSRDCVTPLHYDLCHGFLCQVVGRKRFLLASPDDTQYLYRNISIGTKNQTSSKVDLNKWFSNLDSEKLRYPNVAEVTWFAADLSPGDILYTPPGWWHHVTSIDTSISVLIPFDMVDEECLSILQSL